MCRPPPAMLPLLSRATAFAVSNPTPHLANSTAPKTAATRLRLPSLLLSLESSEKQEEVQMLTRPKLRSVEVRLLVVLLQRKSSSISPFPARTLEDVRLRAGTTTPRRPFNPSLDDPKAFQVLLDTFCCNISLSLCVCVCVSAKL